MRRMASGLAAAGLAAAVALAASGLLAQGGEKVLGLTTDNFQLDSAQELLEICTLEAAHPDYQTAVGFCYGFISGGGHFHRALSQGPDFDAITCPPREITHDQVVRVFAAYARDNPQYMEEAPMDVLFRAAAAEWPCE